MIARELVCIFVKVIIYEVFRTVAHDYEIKCYVFLGINITYCNLFDEFLIEEKDDSCFSYTS